MACLARIAVFNSVSLYKKNRGTRGRNRKDTDAGEGKRGSGRRRESCEESMNEDTAPPCCTAKLYEKVEDEMVTGQFKS